MEALDTEDIADASTKLTQKCLLTWRWPIEYESYNVEPHAYHAQCSGRSAASIRTGYTQLV